jgi:hypothetical protein
MSFFGRLKRRGVLRVAFGYAMISCFLLKDGAFDADYAEVIADPR